MRGVRLLQEYAMSQTSEAKCDLRVKSLELLRDWRVWLLTVEAAICTALWKTSALKSSGWAFAGWTAFGLSAMTASILLIVVPSVVHKDEKNGVNNMSVQGLAWTECGFFLIGVFCLIYHLWLVLAACRSGADCE